MVLITGKTFGYLNPLIPRTFNIYDMFRVLSIANEMKVNKKNKIGSEINVNVPH